MKCGILKQNPEFGIFILNFDLDLLDKTCFNFKFYFSLDKCNCPPPLYLLRTKKLCIVLTQIFVGFITLTIPFVADFTVRQKGTLCMS